MSDLVPVRRALISVSDKTGVLDFARALSALGVSILSTVGTILVVVGVVLWLAGSLGHSVGPRAHYW